ncbi:hypothetical protein ACROYT_G036143 [Oculina patagonica]
MKAFTSLVVALTVCFVVCSHFLPTTTSEPASSLKQQGQQQAFNLWHRIKRDISSKPSPSANTTLVKNLTTTGVPTVATTYRRPFFGWPTRRRNTPRPTGSALNLTGLTEVQIEKLLRGNRTAPPLDHLGFPKIPNSHRGTRRPPTRTEHNASNPTQNSGKDGDGNFPTEIMGELRKRENGTQASILHSNGATSTNSVEVSSKVLHTEGAQKNTRNDNRRDISLVIAKHSIWISVVASLLLSAFICVMVHWVRRRRRGKLMVAPAGNKGQRSAAVVYKA